MAIKTCFFANKWPQRETPNSINSIIRCCFTLFLDCWGPGVLSLDSSRNSIQFAAKNSSRALAAVLFRLSIIYVVVLILASFFYVFMPSRRPRRYLKTLVRPVASLWFNIGPWRATATSFGPKTTKSVISGHQSSSVVISHHQSSSVIISHHQSS